MLRDYKTARQWDIGVQGITHTFAFEAPSSAAIYFHSEFTAFLYLHLLLTNAPVMFLDQTRIHIIQEFYIYIYFFWLSDSGIGGLLTC